MMNTDLSGPNGIAFTPDEKYLYVTNWDDKKKGNAPPFKRAQTDIVAVEVNSVLPTSDRTFEVEWVETTRDLYGKVKAADRFKGSFTVAISPPTEERQIRTNPLGIYVTQASWAKVL